MKSFMVKLVSALLVVGALGSYNVVLESRSKSEEIARLTAELETSKLAAAVSGDEASEAGYTDGIYTGEAEGFGGPIEVEVSVQDGQIADITILSAENEDGAYFSMAQDIIPVILEQQSAEVDTISGATFSSTGIRDAVTQAIEKAGN